MRERVDDLAYLPTREIGFLVAAGIIFVCVQMSAGRDGDARLANA